MREERKVIKLDSVKKRDLQDLINQEVRTHSSIEDSAIASRLALIYDVDSRRVFRMIKSERNLVDKGFKV